MNKSHLRFVVLVLFTSLFFLQSFPKPVSAIEIVPISSPEDLNNIRNNLSGHYQLTNDIDMSSFGNWVPIGTYEKAFSGILDGNGHTIRNLTISDSESDFIGLFGVIGKSGIVQNLQITNSEVVGHIYVSIFAGVNQGIIDKVSTQGVILGKERVGGLVGYNEGSIINSYAISSVTGDINLGGLVGISAGKINNSFSASSIGNSGATNRGGLVGYKSGSVSYSYYDSNVAGINDTGKGIPLTTAQMKTQSSFSGWDFNNTWYIIENETYPSLFPFSVTIEKDESQPEPASTPLINFIVKSNEPIIKTSFSEEDVVLGGTAGADKVEITEISPFDGTTYKLSVSGMTSDGTVSVSVPEGKVIDTLNNFNLTGISNIVTYEPDTTPPTISISSTTTSPTNSSSIPISIDFSEDVIGFNFDDINVTNGTLENFSGSGKDYTADLIPSLDGTVVVNIPADVAEDAAGNGNTAASPFNIKYDSTPPGVTISSVFDLNPYNLSTLLVDVKFNEKVIGFSKDDLHITSGSIWHVIPLSEGQRYHVIIDQMTDGLITIVVPEGAVTDAAGNRNQPSNQLSILYDSTPPTVTINQSPFQNDPTNNQPIDFIATFSEPILTSSFIISDLTIDGISETPTITITEIAPNDGTTFNIALSGLTQSGTPLVKLLNGKVLDLALNGNLQSTSTDNSVEFDITDPTVTLSTSVSDITNISPIPISIEFSEEVVEFDITDVVVSNGTPANLSGSGDSYTAEITPTEEGLIKIEIPENIAIDHAGNPNVAATPLEITYDKTKPLVSIEKTDLQTDPTNELPIIFTIKFSKPIFMESFTVSDLDLQAPAGATIISISELEPYDDTTFEVSINGVTEDGLVTLTMPEGKVQDLAGNYNSTSTSTDNSIEYDISPPAVKISTVISTPTNLSFIPITIEFSESVIGFELNDISVSNGTAENFSGKDKSYTVDISPIEDGTISIVVLSGIANDFAGNGNTASNKFTFEYDGTPPTVVVEQSAIQTDPTNSDPILFTATFSEPIDSGSFTKEDVLVVGSAGASDVSITEISPTTYEIIVDNILKNGTIVVSIPADKVKDMAGNFNITSTSKDNIVTVDTADLTVIIEKSENQPNPTNSIPILFTVQFNKPINLETLTKEDFLLEGPEGIMLTGISEIDPKDKTTFEIQIDGLLEDGLVTLTLPEGKVQDLAGNFNSANTSVNNSVLYDTVSPLVDKIDIEKFYAGHPPDQFIITFTKAMYNPEGDNEPDDVTNPLNYLLVEWGENATFDTTSCKDGWQEDDQLIRISSVSYEEVTFATILKLPYKLPEGSYRLFVCGSATLYDTAMNPFNNRLDAIFSFNVIPKSEEKEEQTNNTPALLPQTGFPNGQTTVLAKQRDKSQYSKIDLVLELPKFGFKTNIVGIPLIDGGWDVSWLGNQAGYLYGSAYPTWQGNTVITGHVWNANNTPGIFFNLKTLKYGDLIRIHAYGMIYTYEVRENRLISETNLKVAFQSEEYDWVTLITCEGYQPREKTYAARRMVRAVLVNVE